MADRIDPENEPFRGAAPGAEDFYRLLRRRRMVRNYTDQSVDRDTIDRIVEAGRRGPSAGYSQGISFVVVTDRSIREEIARIADEAEYLAAGFEPWISRAPVHIVVNTSEEVYQARYREPDKSPDGTGIDWPVPYWWVDAGAAMMLILLAAVAEGLAAGFLGTHAMPELKEALGLPDDVEPIGVVTIGHPAPDPRSGSRKRGRKPRSDTVHRQHWGGGSTPLSSGPDPDR